MSRNLIGKSLSVKWILGAVFGALVLIFFWGPVWHFIGEIADKASHIFPGSK